MFLPHPILLPFHPNHHECLDLGQGVNIQTAAQSQPRAAPQDMLPKIPA